jgi:hypothetical protein
VGITGPLFSGETSWYCQGCCSSEYYWYLIILTASTFPLTLCCVSYQLWVTPPPPSPSSLCLTSLLVFLERKLYRTRRGRGRMDFIFGGEYHATTTTTTTTTSLPPKMKSHHPLPLQQIESRKEIQFLRIPAHFSLKHGCPGG